MTAGTEGQLSEPEPEGTDRLRPRQQKDQLGI